MKNTDVTIGKAQVYAQLLPSNGNKEVLTLTSRPTELNLHGEIFNVSTVIQPSKDEEQVCESLATPLNDWLWSGFNASMICHGTDVGMPRAMHRLAETCVCDLFRRIQEEMDTGVLDQDCARVGVSVWELDPFTGNKSDLLATAEAEKNNDDDVTTVHVTMCDDALRLLRHSNACSSQGRRPTRSRVVRLVFCRGSLSNGSAVCGNGRSSHEMKKGVKRSLLESNRSDW